MRIRVGVLTTFPAGEQETNTTGRHALCINNTYTLIKNDHGQPPNFETKPTWAWGMRTLTNYPRYIVSLLDRLEHLDALKSFSTSK